LRPIRGTAFFADGAFHPLELSVEGGRIASVGRSVSPGQAFPLHQYLIIPGFVDVHVHLREPGFSYKETVASGTLAAARAGVTSVVSMPNVAPAPDSIAGLEAQMEIIRRDARIRVIPCGRITKGDGLSDMEAIAPFVAGFSDDGFGVQGDALMERAMLKVGRLGKIIVAHCEDASCPKDSPESEWKQLERDLILAERTGCRYHACHLSTKESVELMRRFKARGVDATCETAPHYLVFSDEEVRDSGRFKMNPPIRKRADREALIDGLRDGTIDMVATDHAPHSMEEKSRGFAGSLSGIVGLETAFPALYTHLVLPGLVPLERLLDAMCYAPRKRFGIPGGLAQGDAADLAILDLEAERVVDPAEFKSMGRCTPFEGMMLKGEAVLTLVAGELVWQKEGFAW
jgi:dihydroorotase